MYHGLTIYSVNARSQSKPTRAMRTNHRKSKERAKNYMIIDLTTLISISIAIYIVLLKLGIIQAHNGEKDDQSGACWPVEKGATFTPITRVPIMIVTSCSNKHANCTVLGPIKSAGEDFSSNIRSERQLTCILLSSFKLTLVFISSFWLPSVSLALLPCLQRLTVEFTS